MQNSKVLHLVCTLLDLKDFHWEKMNCMLLFFTSFCHIRAEGLICLVRIFAICYGYAPFHFYLFPLSFRLFNRSIKKMSKTWDFPARKHLKKCRPRLALLIFLWLLVRRIYGLLGCFNCTGVESEAPRRKGLAMRLVLGDTMASHTGNTATKTMTNDNNDSSGKAPYGRGFFRGALEPSSAPTSLFGGGFRGVTALYVAR